MILDFARYGGLFLYEVCVKVYCKVDGELRVYSVETSNHEAAIAAVRFAEGGKSRPIFAVIPSQTAKQAMAA
jgi:hypothetical protein